MWRADRAATDLPGTLAQAITDADDGVDGLTWTRFRQLAAKVADRYPNGVREWVGAVVPDVLEQAFGGHDLVRMEHEVPEEGEFLRCQIEAIAVPVGLMPGRVEIECAKPDGGTFVDGRSSSQRADARCELREAEWLHDIVVGAVVEAADAIVERIPRREHQHTRRGGLRDVQHARTELTADVPTVTIGQAEIQAHDVVLRLLEALPGIAGRRCCIDGIAFPA